MMAAKFFNDWPAEDYPEAVAECRKALLRNIPRRNENRSCRLSARWAIEQARYLGLTSIKPGQIDFFPTATPEAP